MAASVALVCGLAAAIASTRQSTSEQRLALISVVEFADFQCPACRRFALNHWPAVMLRFKDSVKLVFRHWPQPSHPFAYQAAVASVCASYQGRFTQMHDLLYLKQAHIGTLSFESFAKESGVSDLREFNACLGSSGPRRTVDADVRAAREIGGVGTPTLVIEGVVHRLRSDTTWLPHLIDSLLALKRDSLAKPRRG